MAARRATVNRCRRNPLGLAPDLDAEQLGLAQRLAARPAGDAPQDVITAPPQLGQVSGTASTSANMNLRPQPQRRQNPQLSPSSSRLRRDAMARFCHTGGGRHGRECR
jgi:hypothetical protein